MREKDKLPPELLLLSSLRLLPLLPLFFTHFLSLSSSPLFFPLFFLLFPSSSNVFYFLLLLSFFIHLLLPPPPPLFPPLPLFPPSIHPHLPLLSSSSSFSPQLLIVCQQQLEFYLAVPGASPFLFNLDSLSRRRHHLRLEITGDRQRKGGWD